MLRSHLLHVAKHEQGQLVEVEAGADHIHLLAAEFITMMIILVVIIMKIMMIIMMMIKLNNGDDNNAHIYLTATGRHIH